jgi:hypothetical protein
LKPKSTEEIAALFDAFLEDQVTYAVDGYLDNEGKVHGTRKVFAIRE